ncbi:hypothetical protein ADK37_17110 [Streptomyces resistomycificus]|uniref:Uncharacterized protein n=1 Tax=Streptomyces resistomycificus TaxID=67356 RepID=A0A0L8L9F1_9ACTN|nr:hypothetical protein ADK37_17110 [Streptomyces resistomycificus]
MRERGQGPRVGDRGAGAGGGRLWGCRPGLRHAPGLAWRRVGRRGPRIVGSVGGFAGPTRRRRPVRGVVAPRLRLLRVVGHARPPSVERAVMLRPDPLRRDPGLR